MINKRNKPDIGRIITCILLFLLFWYIAFYVPGQNRLNKSFEGVVTGKYVDTLPGGDHYQIFISGHRYSFGVGEFDCYYKIDSGDYIIKRKGEKNIQLIKVRSDTLIPYR